MKKKQEDVVNRNPLVNPLYFWGREMENHLSKEKMLCLLNIPLPALPYVVVQENISPSQPPPPSLSFPLQEDVSGGAIVWEEGSYFTYAFNDRQKWGKLVIILFLWKLALCFLNHIYTWENGLKILTLKVQLVLWLYCEFLLLL